MENDDCKAARGQAAIESLWGATGGSLRGQAATETLVLVGFALVFILPLAFLFLTTAGNELSKTSLSQAKISARTIADEAGEVYLQGEHARKTVIVNYPSGVTGGIVEGGLVVLTLEEDGRRVDITSATFANVSGNLSGRRTAGLQVVELEYVSEGNYVNVSYAE